MPVVYTVITNGYDQLKDPLQKSVGWRYLCFSDTPIQSDVWEWVPYYEHNRKVKILGHNYQNGVTLYVDGSVQITGNLNKLLLEIPHRFSLPRHGKRNCIFEEAKELLRRDMVVENVLTPQLARYSDDGYPVGNGLGDNRILLRDLSNPIVQKINEMWWREYCGGVSRDQVSLMYCVWKNFIEPELVPQSIMNRFFRKTKHEG